VKVIVLFAIVAGAMASAVLFAQGSAKATASRGATSPPPEKSPGGKSSGGFNFSNPDQVITTEIYADEAFFDSVKNVGKFSGHVKVNDPRFAIQSDKLTAYISKENQGLEKAVADGHVGVVRDRPDPKGGPPQRSIGLSENAVYTTNDGNVQLTGNPRVQQGMNTHIATQPDTVMILNQEGQLTTRGPSRTEIRQQPSPSPSPTPTESPKR
jgi:lipopolysaccharide transport protein LptA